MPDKRIVTQQKAADRFDVTPRTIRNWITAGLITGYKLPRGGVRVDLDEIENMIKVIPTVRAGRKKHSQPYGPKAKIVSISPSEAEADDEESDNQAPTQVEAMAGVDR